MVFVFVFVPVSVGHFVEQVEEVNEWEGFEFEIRRVRCEKDDKRRSMRVGFEF